MSRKLRLFACASGMLAVAVLACMLLRDDERIEAGSQEVAGKLVGVHGSAAPEGRNVVSRAVPVQNGATAQPARVEEQTAPARVKVLELARVTADNKAEAKARPVPAQVENIALPASLVPQAPALPSGPVELEAQSLVMASGEAVEAPAVKAEEPAVTSAPAAEVKKDAPKKAETKKSEAKKAQPRKETKKAEKKKAEAKKQEAKPNTRLSAVDAALADARSGRLAPVEDVLVEDDPAKEYDRVVTSAKFSMKGSLIKLTLRGNSPMIGHFYVLESPDRVVLDLAGNWKIDMPKVPSNRLIGAVRVGQHEDKTRLVFDMKTVGKAALVPLNRNALELRIQ